MATRIDSDVIISGDLQSTTMTLPASCVSNSQVSSTAAIDRSKLAQDSNKPYAIRLSDFRVWDSVATVLPGTAGSDDLAFDEGTWGTNPSYITTGDIKTTSSTRYARVLIPIPAEYVDAETVTLRLSCGMQTTVADGSCTIDAVVYENTGASATGISADLCATAAQSMNSLTAANKDFVITSTDLVAGDVLDVRIAIAYVDTATVGAVIGNIYKAQLLVDVKG